MGYLFSHFHKQDLIEELTRETDTFRSLRSTLRGSTLYQLAETKPKEGAPQRFILVHLIRKNDGLWGSKDMDETCGPHYYDCPLSYLDEATEPMNEWAAEWRDKVRQHHERKKRSRGLYDAIQPGWSVEVLKGLTCNGRRLSVGKVKWKQRGRLVCHFDGVGLVQVRPGDVSKVFSTTDTQGADPWTS